MNELVKAVIFVLAVMAYVQWVSPMPARSLDAMPGHSLLGR